MFILTLAAIIILSSVAGFISGRFVRRVFLESYVKRLNEEINLSFKEGFKEGVKRTINKYATDLKSIEDKLTEEKHLREKADKYRERVEYFKYDLEETPTLQ